MRRSNLLLSLLLLATATRALDTPGLIAAAPPADRFPADDVVVLHRSETITMDDQHRVTRRVHTVQRLQTQWAIRSQADPRLAWDAGRQELEVLIARTYMRDGTQLDTPSNGFNEVTPDAVVRAAPFLDLRELVVTFIGTEPGCVVELAYEVRDLTPPALPPSGRCWLGADFPVLEAVCEVSGPDIVVTSSLGLDDGLPVRATGLPGYASVPARRREDVIPHVAWGLATDDGDQAAAGARAVGAAAEGAAAGPRLRSWLDRQRDSGEMLTSADLVQRIAAEAHDRIADVALPTGPWSRAPRPVDEVHRTAVGTAWERALVAKTLLEAAGHAPELGLFDQGGGTSDLLPFTDLRVVVRLGDQNWWLAPDRGQAWSGNCDLPGADGTFLSADGSIRRYTVPSLPLTCRWHVRLAPDGGRWQATADLELSGLGGRVSDPRELAEQLAGQLLAGGELDDFDLRESSGSTLALRLTATSDQLGDADQGPLTYRLPWPEQATAGALLSGFDLHRDALVAPLAPERACVVDASLTLAVPDGWQVDAPLATELLIDGRNAQVEHMVQEQPGGLKVIWSLRLDGQAVGPDDWPAYRQATLTWRRLTDTAVVLVAD